MRTSFSLSALLLTALLPLVFIPCVANAGIPGAQPRSLFEWIEQPETLEVVLETDLRALLSDKNDEFLPATFSFKDAMGQEQRLATGIKPRGKFRRRVCDFPPLKLKFEDEELVQRGLLPFGSLKVVTHCLANVNGSMDNLLREYLAYELYQQMTPMSYRVKLAQITYMDAKKREKPITRMAFFIEPTEEMAYRLEGEEVEDFGISIEKLEPRNSAEMRIFQYFIGNTDWSINTLHNVKLIRHTESGDLLAVPYDFDFAGWVDPIYAIPNPNIGQTDIRDRYFFGEPPSLDAWNACYSRLEYIRPSLEARIQGLEGLSNGAKRDMMRYVDSFFQRDSKQLVKRIQGDLEGA
ncbi:MAG: hypothetical protein WA004_12895 [Saprospiraceae bacterium]